MGLSDASDSVDKFSANLRYTDKAAANKPSVSDIGYVVTDVTYV